MGRSRNPRRDEAYRMYIRSEGTKKLKDIADFLKVPSSRVRKWKAEDRWDEELAKPLGQRWLPPVHIGPPFGSQNALGNRGGPGGKVGNKNAAGHKGVRRNVNAMVTGEYATIWTDTLSEEERALLTGVDKDPLSQIDGTILLLTIRERRMMELLRALKAQRDLQGPGADLIEDTVRTVRMKGDTVTNKEVLSERKLTEKILAIEEALTRVQEKKIRAIEAKHRMMKELNQYGDTSGDATVVILPEKDLEK